MLHLHPRENFWYTFPSSPLILAADNVDADMVDVHAPVLPAPILGNGPKPECLAATQLSPSIPAVSSSETAVDSIAPSSSYPRGTVVVQHDDDDKAPPAKRTRKYSDAERASIANVSPHLPCAIHGVLIRVIAFA